MGWCFCASSFYCFKSYITTKATACFLVYLATSKWLQKELNYHTTVRKGVKKFICPYSPHSAVFMALWRIPQGLCEKGHTGRSVRSHSCWGQNRSVLPQGLRSKNHAFSDWIISGGKSVRKCGFLILRSFADVQGLLRTEIKYFMEGVVIA